MVMQRAGILGAKTLGQSTVEEIPILPLDSLIQILYITT